MTAQTGMKDTRELRAVYDAISARIEALRDELCARPRVAEAEFVAERGFGYAETYEQYVARRTELRAEIQRLEDEQFALNAELFT